MATPSLLRGHLCLVIFIVFFMIGRKSEGVPCERIKHVPHCRWLLHRRDKMKNSRGVLKDSRLNGCAARMHQPYFCPTYDSVNELKWSESFENLGLFGMMVCLSVLLRPESKFRVVTNLVLLGLKGPLFMLFRNESVENVLLRGVHRYGAGKRRRVVVSGPSPGTVYLNTAVVPRFKSFDGKGPKAHHFCMVRMSGGRVIEATDVWVKVDTNLRTDKVSCGIVNEQRLCQFVEDAAGAETRRFPYRVYDTSIGCWTEADEEDDRELIACRGE